MQFCHAAAKDTVNIQLNQETYFVALTMIKNYFLTNCRIGILSPEASGEVPIYFLYRKKSHELSRYFPFPLKVLEIEFCALVLTFQRFE